MMPKFLRAAMLVCMGIALSGCGGGGSSASSTAAPPALQWSAPSPITYGTALGASQLDATASAQGAFTYSPGSGTVLTAGTHTLTATFTPANSASASQSSVTTTITVNKATPTITWAAPAAVTVGTALGSAQLDATASVPGTFAYSPVAGTTMSTSGNQTLSVTFTPTDSADYGPAQGSVTLTVNAAVSNGPPSYSWTNVRIVAGGYVTGVYFSPTEKNLMYVRTDVGGAYRWGPNDSQWVPLLDFMSRAQNNWTGVESIGLDPTDPKKLYLAAGLYDASWAGDCAMLISDDQGATFKIVPLSFKCGSNEPGRGTGERIAVDPNLPSIVYFGTRDNGLQISTDSGNTWNPETDLSVTTSNPDGTWTASDGVVSVIPIPASGSSGAPTPVVYAIVAGSGTGGTSQGVYVTTDGGTTASAWVAVSGQPSFPAPATPLAPLEARLGPNGAIYILYGDQAGPDRMNTSELWKFVPGSTWTAGTWTQIMLPNQTLTINKTNGYGGLAVDPHNPGVLLLGTLDQYWPTGDVVYRSTDDGATWRDISSVKGGSAVSKSPNLATHDNSQAPYFGAPGTVSTGNWVTAMAIDPFNPAHAMYGFGGGLWMSSDVTNADPSATSTGVVDWTLNDLGIEETAIEGLWAPPSGSTLLLSSIGDVYGFAHQDLTVSPPKGNYTNPAATPTSMDFEQNTPTTAVRVVDGTWGASPLGALSNDAGVTWTGFGSMPTGTTKGGGSIAVAPDGSALVWAPEDTSSVWFSKDMGSTWTASTGISAQAQVMSDRVKAGVFYGYANGTLSISTDGGATFTTVQTGLPAGGLLNVLPDAQADLWITGGWNGSSLYANTGSATSPSMTVVSGVQTAYHLGFGKAAAGSKHLTLFLDGQIGGQWGTYRSTDGAASWIRINDDAHQWGGAGPVCGDMRTFGTVYIATGGGRGIIWGTSAQ
jgi:hypothetical protein